MNYCLWLLTKFRNFFKSPPSELLLFLQNLDEIGCLAVETRLSFLILSVTLRYPGMFVKLDHYNGSWITLLVRSEELGFPIYCYGPSQVIPPDALVYLTDKHSLPNLLQLERFVPDGTSLPLCIDV